MQNKLEFARSTATVSLKGQVYSSLIARTREPNKTGLLRKTIIILIPETTHIGGNTAQIQNKIIKCKYNFMIDESTLNQLES